MQVFEMLACAHEDDVVPELIADCELLSGGGLPDGGWGEPVCNLEGSDAGGPALLWPPNGGFVQMADTCPQGIAVLGLPDD